MSRYNNSDISGGSFSEETKIQVWNKARKVVGFDPDLIRQDLCGATIEWYLYGNTTSGGRGWEIDHIVPVSRGGTDDLQNLQPLQWQNNRSKGDSYPVSNYCVVSH